MRTTETIMSPKCLNCGHGRDIHYYGRKCAVAQGGGCACRGFLGYESDLDVVFGAVTDWADTTFPASTLASKYAHLQKEVAELGDDFTSAEEIADCVMILAHMAAGIGIDLKRALLDKLVINRARTWGEPDADGVIEHVKEPTS